MCTRVPVQVVYVCGATYRYFYQWRSQLALGNKNTITCLRWRCDVHVSTPPSHTIAVALVNQYYDISKWRALLPPSVSAAVVGNMETAYRPNRGHNNRGHVHSIEASRYCLPPLLPWLAAAETKFAHDRPFEKPPSYDINLNLGVCVQFVFWLEEARAQARVRTFARRAAFFYNCFLLVPEQFRASNSFIRQICTVYGMYTVVYTRHCVLRSCAHSRLRLTHSHCEYHCYYINPFTARTTVHNVDVTLIPSNLPHSNVGAVLKALTL